MRYALCSLFIVVLSACPTEDGPCTSTSDCAKGKACCNKKCTDVQNDKNNCGDCGNVCELPNVVPQCRVGRCQLTCQAGWGNCNGERDDGCELDVKENLTNCGICNRTCVAQNAAPVCRMSMCNVGTCNANFEDCDTDSTNGCEVDTRIDSMHCGGCRQACVLPNATSHCEASACAVDTCAANFGDCDTMPLNGCEAAFPTDPNHCGRCNYVCGPGQFCAAAKCRANELITFGGALSFTMSGATAELHRFNLASNTWEAITAVAPNGFPTPRSRHLAFYDQPRNRMLVWGGVDGAGTPMQPDVWVLDFGVSPPRWSTLTVTGTPPSPRFASVGAVDPMANKIYIFGGTTELGEGMSDLFTFDLATNTWAMVHGNNSNNGPRDRINAMGAFDPVARVFMVFGGNDHLFRTDYTELWQYDVVAARWRTPPITNLEGGPPGRARGAFVDGHPVHMFSGVVSLLTAPSSFPQDLRSLDVTAMTPWTLLPGALTQPEARFNAGSTVRDGVMFVYSGGSTTGGTPTTYADLWKFDPASGVWTRLHDGTGTVPTARLAPSIIAR